MQSEPSIPSTRLQVLLISLGGFTPHGDLLPRTFVEERLASLMQASPEEVAFTLQFAATVRMVLLHKAGDVQRIGAVPMLFRELLEPSEPSTAEPAKAKPEELSGERWRGIPVEFLQAVIDHLPGVTKKRTLVPRGKAVQSLVTHSRQTLLVVRSALNLAAKVGMIEASRTSGPGATLVRLTPPFDVARYLSEGRIVRRYRVQGPGWQWTTREDGLP